MQNLATTLDVVFANFALELESCSSFDSFEDAQVEPLSGAVISTATTSRQILCSQLIEIQNLATTLDVVFANFPLELEGCSSFDSFEDAQVEPLSGAVMSTAITVVKHVIRELIVALA
ncbi:hypothetical protein DPX16_4212 [Anabarilius grahami]|uniref:Uncharacterized protein n=1 Tax=Anabarilius grahami TaxID=495550 RepID=A0A3N0YQA0_ANAGA|nr:hypothetical protein DPX16_4212 [Anabarilius grahami]